jgi:hypothetical protein
MEKIWEKSVGSLTISLRLKKATFDKKVMCGSRYQIGPMVAVLLDDQGYVLDASIVMEVSNIWVIYVENRKAGVMGKDGVFCVWPYAWAC